MQHLGETKQSTVTNDDKPLEDVNEIDEDDIQKGKQILMVYSWKFLAVIDSVIDKQV